LPFHENFAAAPFFPKMWPAAPFNVSFFALMLVQGPQDLNLALIYSKSKNRKSGYGNRLFHSHFTNQLDIKP
jgi:hypothetical protein